MKNIAILASGSGTNAENIIKHFQKNNHLAQVKYILTNNPRAGVIERAKNLEVPVLVFNREQFYNSQEITSFLKKEDIDFIVLAGFLWLVPTYLIQAYPKAIINIHPALLPKFGGKGMYGSKVHQAVWEAKEQQTGITIHYVNEHYDQGDIIFQTAVTLSTNDTPESIAQKIHELEQKHFPIIIERLLIENS